MTISRLVHTLIYYCIAQYLPSSNSRIPLLGKFGRRFRYYCCSHIFLSIGKNVNIERRAYFGNGAIIEIGDNSGIGTRAHLPNNIKIGDNVLMGPDCYFFDCYTHKAERTDIPIIKQGMRRIDSPTVIGDDVWLGMRCVVMPGVTIGKGTIIGACSVVSKNIPEYVLAVGSPIVIKKKR